MKQLWMALTLLSTAALACVIPAGSVWGSETPVAAPRPGGGGATPAQIRSDEPVQAPRPDFVNAEIRERQAVEQLRRLGGEVQYTDFALPDPHFPGTRRRHLQHVILDHHWRGGDEGLKYIHRLEILERLYIIDRVVSPEAERQLAADMPQLQIQHRSRALLGVAGMPAAAGCLISGVKPRSAAARAGIQPGDAITRIGGKDVPDFDAMVQRMYDYKPGDRVQIEIDRRGRPLKLEVVMDGWTDADADP